MLNYLVMRISSNNFSIYLSTLKVEDASAIKEGAEDEEIALSLPYDMSYPLPFIEVAIQKFEAKEEFHMGVYLAEIGLIGLCALGAVDKQNSKAELGYWIAKKYQGKGYGKEAIRLILGFGFRELRLNRIYAKVLKENVRSIGLLDSLGFKKEGTLREDVVRMGVFFDAEVFGMLRSQYNDEIYIDVVDYK